ncbi:MAG: pseudouridine synthase [Rhabdochlamydiaceae bacterium]
MNTSEKKKRLSKALASAGVASRRACEELIFEGKVEVNGRTVLLPQTLVDWEKDVIKVDGEFVKGEQKKVYFILNKPEGYICSNKPVGTKKLVIDLFANEKERLFTIGRLDRDTTGLLLLTNDGFFAQKVIHPSSNIVKEYLVKTDRDVTDVHLKAISKGTLVEGCWITPKKVQKVRKNTIKICVMEGKKREVRYLTQASGLQVLSLERIRIGSLTLGTLPIGGYRVLTEREKELIFE